MELEKSPEAGFTPAVDRRPRMPEPLPVNLVAVDDVHLPAPPDLQEQLDAFYVGLLGLEPVLGEGTIVYRTANFSLRLDTLPPPGIREDYRALGIEVASLAQTQAKLVEAEIEHTRQRGLVPGQEVLVLQDPAGNWLQISESRAVR